MLSGCVGDSIGTDGSRGGWGLRGLGGGSIRLLCAGGIRRLRGNRALGGNRLGNWRGVGRFHNIRSLRNDRRGGSGFMVCGNGGGRRALGNWAESGGGSNDFSHNPGGLGLGACLLGHGFDNSLRSGICCRGSGRGRGSGSRSQFADDTYILRGSSGSSSISSLGG